jgi:orotidine-5'-phosphate decarboxylase
VARTATFLERLHAAAEANRSWLCVGLDPEPSRVPAAVRTDDPLEWVPRFLAGIIEATRDLVCCYKPNVAFFEAFGAVGWEALRRTLDAIPPEVPTLGDAKRGDTPHTVQAYARGLFEQMGFDAVTANPYLGGDGLEPLFAYADRGVFVLCKTSNPGSGELQDLEVRTPEGRFEAVYLHVARKALSWDRHGTLGLVVGATYPAELAAVRAIAPHVPLLIPGVGAQAGDLEACVRAAGGRAMINASRSVLYASSDPAQWQDAARREAQRLRTAIEGATAAAAPHV